MGFRRGAEDYWALRWAIGLVVVSVLCCRSDAVALQPPAVRSDIVESEDAITNGDYGSIFFLKFHKVGGTTASIKLLEVAEQNGYTENCEGGEKTVCVEHRTLEVLKNWRSGAPPIERITLLFPRPLRLTLLRDPIEKLLSSVYYSYSMRHRFDFTNEDILEMMPRAWNRMREYAPVLGRGVKGLVTAENAIQCLKQFDVVGVTENEPAFFAQAAYKLNLPIESFVYKSAKIMKGRPSFDEHSPEIQAKIVELMQINHYKEQHIYDRAKIMAMENVVKWKLQDNVAKITALLEAEMDKDDCDTSQHTTGDAGLTGRWCYDFEGEHKA